VFIEFFHEICFSPFSFKLTCDRRPFRPYQARDNSYLPTKGS
jgi:hypothetical protein